MVAVIIDIASGMVVKYNLTPYAEGNKVPIAGEGQLLLLVDSLPSPHVSEVRWDGGSGLRLMSVAERNAELADEDAKEKDSIVNSVPLPVRKVMASRFGISLKELDDEIKANA